MWTRFPRTRLSRQPDYCVLCPPHISAPSLQARLGPTSPQAPEPFILAGLLGPPGMFPDVKPFSKWQLFLPLSLNPPSAALPGYELLSPLTPCFAPTCHMPPAWWAWALGTAQSQHLFVHISLRCPNPGRCPASRVWTCDRSMTNSLERRAVGAVWPWTPPHFLPGQVLVDLTWGPSGEEVGLPAAAVATRERQYESLDHVARLFFKGLLL